jgi:branched-chain amino acid transport system permease protein
MISAAIITSCVVGLIALGFGLIYNTARFFHFGHGGVFACAAYCAWFLLHGCNAPFWLAIVSALVLSAVLGLGMDFVFYRPLRRWNAGGLSLMLVSMGLLLVLQNLLSILFTDSPKTLRLGPTREGFLILGARLTSVQITIIFASAFLLALTAAILRYSRWGRSCRAVANDSELARIVGINTDRLIASTFAVGSFLAGVAAILVSSDVDMTPHMGLSAIILAMVAVVLAGARSMFGTAAAGLLLGFTGGLAVWFVGLEWQDAITFGVPIAFLILRPRGFGHHMFERTST